MYSVQWVFLRTPSLECIDDRKTSQINHRGFTGLCIYRKPTYQILFPKALACSSQASIKPFGAEISNCLTDSRVTPYLPYSIRRIECCLCIGSFHEDSIIGNFYRSGYAKTKHASYPRQSAGNPGQASSIKLSSTYLQPGIRIQSGGGILIIPLPRRSIMIAWSWRLNTGIYNWGSTFLNGTHH